MVFSGILRFNRHENLCNFVKPIPENSAASTMSISQAPFAWHSFGWDDHLKTQPW